MLIYCIKRDENGVISNIGWTYEESDEIKNIKLKNFSIVNNFFRVPHWSKNFKNFSG